MSANSHNFFVLKTKHQQVMGRVFTLERSREFKKRKWLPSKFFKVLLIINLLVLTDCCYENRFLRSIIDTTSTLGKTHINIPWKHYVDDATLSRRRETIWYCMSFVFTISLSLPSIHFASFYIYEMHVTQSEASFRKKIVLNKY